MGFALKTRSLSPGSGTPARAAASTAVPPDCPRPCTNDKQHSACTKVAFQIYRYRYKQNKYLGVCSVSLSGPLLPSPDWLLLPGRTSTCAKFPVIASFPPLIAAGGSA